VDAATVKQLVGRTGRRSRTVPPLSGSEREPFAVHLFNRARHSSPVVLTDARTRGTPGAITMWLFDN